MSGCPAGCNIPTGIPGFFVNAPGVDCSGCAQGALNKVGQAVANPNSVVDQTVVSGAAGALNTMLQPLLQALPTIGIKVGLFMLALMLVIVGFMIVTRGTS